MKNRVKAETEFGKLNRHSAHADEAVYNNDWPEAAVQFAAAAKRAAKLALLEKDNQEHITFGGKR